MRSRRAQTPPRRITVSRSLVGALRTNNLNTTTTTATFANKANTSMNGTTGLKNKNSNNLRPRARTPVRTISAGPGFDIASFTSTRNNTTGIKTVNNNIDNSYNNESPITPVTPITSVTSVASTTQPSTSGLSLGGLLDLTPFNDAAHAVRQLSTNMDGVLASTVSETLEEIRKTNRLLQLVTEQASDFLTVWIVVGILLAVYILILLIKRRNRIT